MALTISNQIYSVQGNKRVTYGQLAFDTSYPTGGMSLTAANLGLDVLDKIELDDHGGYAFDYDYTNSKVRVLYGPNTTDAIISSQTTSVGTASDTSVDTLMTYSLPANALNVNGASIRIRAWGTTSGDSNNKTVALVFGATTLLSSGAKASNATPWYMESTVIRTSATGQNFVSQGQHSGTLLTAGGTTAGETLSGAVLIKVTGQNGTATTNGVVQNGMVIELMGPATTSVNAMEVLNATDLSGMTAVKFKAEGA